MAAVNRYTFAGFFSETTLLQGIAAAFSVGIRNVRVELALEPAHSTPTAQGDALNPASWSLQRQDTGEYLTVISVAQVALTVYDLATIEKLGDQFVSYLVTAALDGTYPSAPFAGLRSVEDSQPALMVACKAAQRDLACPPVPSDTMLGGTFVIAGGDYETVESVDLLKKLILRRLVTRPGEFAHLPDYGIGLADKEPIKSTARLEKEIADQVGKEPEVDSAMVKVVVDADNGIVSILIRVKMKTTGQQINLQFSPAGEGWVAL
jgi:hypothetical protein